MLRPGRHSLYSEIAADEVKWFFPGPADVIPWAGMCRGPEQVGQFFSRLSQAVEIHQFEPKDFVAQGDRVIVMGDEKATVKSTGRSFTKEWAHAWTLRDGKIVELREYHDTSAIVEAFQSA